MTKGSGTKTDIEWIKEALKRGECVWMRVEKRLNEDAIHHAEKHEKLEGRLRATEIRGGFWGAVTSAVVAIAAYLGLGRG